MSDLMITTLVATSLVVGTLAIVGYLLHRSETHEVAGLLTRIKCVCGHAPLTWNGGVWNIEWHCHDSHDPVKYPLAEGDSDTVVDGSGYVFECPSCARSLWFTHDGRLHRAEGREQRKATSPPGLSSQPDHNFLLRVSESPWFNLPFAFIQTDEYGDQQDLVAASKADRLYSKPSDRPLPIEPFSEIKSHSPATG